MVNIELLKEEMEEVGISKDKLAEKCNMSRQTLYNKLDNPNSITANEAQLFASALRITDVNRLMDIFFAKRVEENIN